MPAQEPIARALLKLGNAIVRVRVSMRFPEPLLPGRLVRRFKRFFAEVALERGESVLAHCPNPGSMLGLAAPGSRVLVAPVSSPTAKLAWRWELASDTAGSVVGINTGLANRLVEEALEGGRIAELTGYRERRGEVRYGQASRVDFLLSGAGLPPCYLEVKSVTLRRGAGPGPGLAEFPDSVTARGARHLDELAAMAQAGARAVLLFLVQRADCEAVAVAGDIDPAYLKAFERARTLGVETLCYACRVEAVEIAVTARLPFLEAERHNRARGVS
ncbi:MAG: DNA/RNA nuclease SfsA [Kiloniellales bacterium]